MQQLTHASHSRLSSILGFFAFGCLNTVLGGLVNLANLGSKQGTIQYTHVHPPFACKQQRIAAHPLVDLLVARKAAAVAKLVAIDFTDVAYGKMSE
jgi:hypothetical protein